MSIFLIKPCQTGGAGQPGTVMGMGGTREGCAPLSCRFSRPLGLCPHGDRDVAARGLPFRKGASLEM